jgi:radical SAM-linked protein
MEGVYVPEVHAEHRNVKINRRMVRDLDSAHYPADYIVPYTQLVHDRIGLEIMRGCTHGCRFCQAGITGRPVRMRSVERLDELMERLIDNTGYDEVSLVSLSTCDYPRIRALLSRATARASRGSIAVSVPSLRLDTFSVELSDAIAGPRRSGLTFAPEAATPRLRRLINKYYEDEELLTIAEESFRRGWEHVKLYFMIGIPTETDEDVEAIADLCLRVLDRGRSVTRRAKVFTGISTFVPKPHTPLQWAPQIPPEEIRRRHAILERRFGRNPGIKFGRHEPESSFIEGLLSRADRKGADLIEAAYRRGARLDSSSEMLKAEAWMQAIEDARYDVDAALRARDLDEPLPWDHIDAGVAKEWLRAEWDHAVEGAVTEDCRTAGCRMCGIRSTASEQCSTMLRESKEADAALEIPSRPAEPEPAQRVRFRIGRIGEPRFLSHLEFATAWIRALHRARAPLSFSQGFHQHPKVTFSTALPLGEESEAEYMDAVLRERVDAQELLAALRKMLPPGFRVYDAEEVPLRAPSLMQSVAGHDYILRTTGDLEELASRIAAVTAASTLDVERKGRPEGRRKKKQIKEIDIRPMITELAAEKAEDGAVIVRFSTRMHDGKLAKPKDILALLNIDAASTQIVKTATILAE